MPASVAAIGFGLFFTAVIFVSVWLELRSIARTRAH